MNEIVSVDVESKTTESLKRLDTNSELRKEILPLCRIKKGEVWEDPISGHRVGVLDATLSSDVQKIIDEKTVNLVVNDPPYNLLLENSNTSSLSKVSIKEYLNFSEKWIQNCLNVIQNDSNFYLWLGADYNDDFQPLPDIMILLRKFDDLKPRNMNTLRNQRGYGTHKNWMWVRQELLYYVKGQPKFNVEAVYTDIPKILRGYYKEIDGAQTENLQRSRSKNIRAGNVWVDIQQVFYRMEENVPGCYAQKPLKAIERIIESGSNEGDVIADFFSHSGTTLIAGERLNRRVFTFDIDPVFAEITIRRLERQRELGKTGWQWRNPFPELDEKLKTEKVS